MTKRSDCIFIFVQNSIFQLLPTFSCCALLYCMIKEKLTKLTLNSLSNSETGTLCTGVNCT